MEDERNRQTKFPAVANEPPTNNASDSETLEAHQAAFLVTAVQEQDQQPDQSHSEQPQRIDERAFICNCPKEEQLRANTEAGGPHCRRCGKIIIEQGSSPSRSSAEHGQRFADGLPFLSSTTEMVSDSNNPSTLRDPERPTRQVSGGQERCAVHGMWRATTCQTPSRSRMFEFYILEEKQLSTNETWLSLLCIPLQCYEDECIIIMADLPLNDIHPIPIRDEDNGETEHFCSISLSHDEKVSIMFDLLERSTVKFRIMAGHSAHEIPLCTILSKSQQSTPVAIAKVFVKCTGTPGERYQGKIRMTIKYGMMLRKFIIPFWFKVQP